MYLRDIKRGTKRSIMFTWLSGNTIDVFGDAKATRFSPRTLTRTTSNAFDLLAGNADAPEDLEQVLDENEVDIGILSMFQESLEFRVDVDLVDDLLEILGFQLLDKLFECLGGLQLLLVEFLEFLLWQDGQDVLSVSLDSTSDLGTDNESARRGE